MPVLNNPHDDEELKTVRESQEDPIVQYYVVRKSLKMSEGKLASQVAHASMIFTLSYKDLEDKIMKTFAVQRGGASYSRYRLCKKWFDGSFRKITKKASDAKFDKIKEEIDCYVVRDAGLTEVETGSETVLVTYPMYRSQCPPVLHKLQNL